MKKFILFGLLVLVGASFVIPTVKSNLAEYVPITTLHQQNQFAEYVPITSTIRTT